MLRKIRLSAPPDRLADLVASARHAWFTLDDYGIDQNDDHGWPYRGDRRAFALVLADDTDESMTQVEAAARGAHIDRTGGLADWLVADGTYVALPDGLPAEWYAKVAPLVDELHAAEAHRATCTLEELAAAEGAVAARRAVLEVVLEPAAREGRRFLNRLTDELVYDGLVALLREQL